MLCTTTLIRRLSPLLCTVLFVAVGTITYESLLSTVVFRTSRLFKRWIFCWFDSVSFVLIVSSGNTGWVNVEMFIVFKLRLRLSVRLPKIFCDMPKCQDCCLKVFESTMDIVYVSIRYKVNEPHECHAIEFCQFIFNNRIVFLWKISSQNR